MTSSPGDTVVLRINGEDHSVPATLSVEGLLRHLEIDTRQVAVERNKELVRRPDFAKTTLADGDEIEIVTFVGGG